MSEPPNGEYVEGYKAGWSAGYTDGKGTGYVDAKVRARLGIEAACDHLDLSRAQRDVLIRTSNNILGTVE